MPNNIIMADPKGGDYWGALKALMMGQDVYFPAMDGVTSVPKYMFYNRTNLKGFNFANITSLYDHAFSRSGILQVVLENATESASGSGLFEACSAMQFFVAKKPFCMSNTYLFSNCSSLEAVDVNSSSKVSLGALSNTALLKTLVLRNGEMVKASGNLPATCGLSDGGKVYVPSALKASYEADTTWSSLASAFETIEGSYYETHYANGDPIPTGG